MLDKNEEILLKKINNICNDDSYKVIDKDELLKVFNGKNGGADKNLSNLIIRLHKDDYINLKYSDDDVYCLTINKKGRSYFNKEENIGREIQKLRKIFFFYTILTGICAFAGTALAIFVFL